MKWAPLTALLLVSAALSACGSGNAPRGQILLGGTIEAREVELSFRAGGLIVELATDEGQAVSRGQTVATLDLEPYRLEVERAEAEMRAARAALQLLQAGSRDQEIRSAEAVEARARAELAFARAELRRVQALVPRELASEEQLEQAQLQLRVAEAGLAQARESLALLREGAREEEIRRAEAEYDARRAAVAIARQQLDFATLQSPVEGLVSVRLAEAGQVVAAGQAVFRVSELSRPWVRAYLNETDLGRVRLGQSARVQVDGIDRTFEGTLTFISPEAEFTPKTVETRELRTGLVYRTKVQVENPEGLLKLGMPADVRLAAADE